MSRKLLSFGQFGDITEGPQSHFEESTGHDWLDQRQAAGLVDRALGAESQLKIQRELGAPRLTGEPDTSPVYEGDVRGRKEGPKYALDTPNTKERPGLNWEVRDSDARPEIMGGPPSRSEPVSHVFRGVREEEFQQAKGRGFIQSDGRGAIEPDWEGTNAAVDLATAQHYLPPEGPSRVMKIAVHPDDGWFTSQHDNYARTRQPIPWDRVEAHTSVLDRSRVGHFRDGVVADQKAREDRQ